MYFIHIPYYSQVLFPPLSCLEVIGEPRVEDGVIDVPLRVNMCLKGLTLEQLVKRRKELHMAMVKNLKEELAIEAQGALARVGAAAEADSSVAELELIRQQFEELEKQHMITHAADFNNDETYKKLTIEAIEGKSQAIRKVEIVAKMLSKAVGAETLAAVVARPLQDFGSRAVLLELETGVADFPWRDIVANQSLVDFGLCRPGWDIFEIAAVELAKNMNFRMAKALNKDGRVLSLELPQGGWAVTNLDCGGSEFCREAPILAALVIRNCASLTCLNLRHAPPPPRFFSPTRDNNQHTPGRCPFGQIRTDAQRAIERKNARDIREATRPAGHEFCKW